MRWLVALALLSVTGSARADGPDRARIAAHVRALTEEIGPRPRNSAAAERAAAWIERQAVAAGLAVERRPVGTIVSPAITVLGRPIMARRTHHVRDDNLVARVAGAAPGPAILVMAHYDTVAGTPGAVDNATGVAILLELGRLLAAGPPPARTVILAWTASEEYGLAGARALAADPPAPIGLAIALDLVGAADDLSLNGLGPLMGARWLDWIAGAARDANVELAAPAPHRVVSRHLPAIERSDHGAFSERGVPAFHLYSRGPERVYLHYHMAGDTADQVSLGAVVRAVALLAALARTPGPLPAAGGAPGMWLPAPGGPRVISSAALAVIEIVLAVAALAGLVPLWRRRQRANPRRARGLVAFAAIYLAAAGAAAVVFGLARWYSGHPAPWVHAPLRFYAAAIVVASCVFVASSVAARRWLPPAGRGRFLAAAILLVTALAGAVAIAGAPELALVPLVAAACLGAAAFARRATGAAPWLALSLAPLPFALDPALLRESVFHGFLPAATPVWPGLAVLLLPYALAAVYLWRAAAPAPARRPAVVLALAGALAVAATAMAALPAPACAGDAFEDRSLYCEAYGDGDVPLSRR